MHHKNIKVIVRKQLKTQYPNWKRLGHKVKQTLVRQVLAEVEATYDFSIPVTTSKAELLGIEGQALTDFEIQIWNTPRRKDKMGSLVCRELLREQGCAEAP